jgi:Protein of unknown function (DUF2934)
MPNERRRRTDVDRPSAANGLPRRSRGASDETIRRRAYEIYEARGGAVGHDLDDWLQAERELRRTARDEHRPAVKPRT